MRTSPPIERLWIAAAGRPDGPSVNGSLDEQDALTDSGALGQLEVPVSIIFGETDRYLNPSLAVEIAGLFKRLSHCRALMGFATTAVCFSPTLHGNGSLTYGQRGLSSTICTRPDVADELNRRSPDAE
jgi:hypothetical protein